MRLGIMQPYFFPYIGHFELIARTDKWVVFDVVKYNRRSWMNRNRILHPTTGWQYIGVPVEHGPLGTPIHAIRIKDKSQARARLIGQLEHYRRHAPFYRKTVATINEVFDRASGDHLVDINVAALEVVCEQLGFAFDWIRASTLEVACDNIAHAGQWALRIAERVGADEYVNPIGGQELFKPEEWTHSGIGLSFLAPTELTYDCRPYRFEPALSIIDVLMWVDPVRIGAHLKQPIYGAGTTSRTPNS